MTKRVYDTDEPKRTCCNQMLARFFERRVEQHGLLGTLDDGALSHLCKFFDAATMLHMPSFDFLMCHWLESRKEHEILDFVCDAVIAGDHVRLGHVLAALPSRSAPESHLAADTPTLLHPFELKAAAEKAAQFKGRLHYDFVNRGHRRHRIGWLTIALSGNTAIAERLFACFPNTLQEWVVRCATNQIAAHNWFEIFRRCWPPHERFFKPYTADAEITDEEITDEGTTRSRLIRHMLRLDADLSSLDMLHFHCENMALYNLIICSHGPIMHRPRNRVALLTAVFWVNAQSEAKYILRHYDPLPRKYARQVLEFMCRHGGYLWLDLLLRYLDPTGMHSLLRIAVSGHYNDGPLRRLLEDPRVPIPPNIILRVCNIYKAVRRRDLDIFETCARIPDALFVDAAIAVKDRQYRQMLRDTIKRRADSVFFNPL
jgi:hypothetical protein